MRIAILGCGPTGLMAAHVARLLGVKFKIFSLNRKSELYGCQYLHAPLPLFPEVPSAIVAYQTVGSAEDYRRKVYGSSWQGLVSPEDFADNHPAWDIRKSYDILWDMYSRYIEDQYVEPHWIASELPYFDKVFSSVPATSICDSNHKFDSVSIYAWGETPTRRIPDEEMRLTRLSSGAYKESFVLCNGLDFPSWYRVSKVFDHGTIEWGLHADKSTILEGSSIVQKPLSNDCDCFPGVIRIGRYGNWRKGILTHHAIDQVWEEIK